MNFTCDYFLNLFTAHRQKTLYTKSIRYCVKNNNFIVGQYPAILTSHLINNHVFQNFAHTWTAQASYVVIESFQQRLPVGLSEN